MYKRSPWTFARASVVAGLVGFSGVVYGQFKRARAHWIFTQSLENPAGFMQALENVNVRTGGVRPLGFTIHKSQQEGEPAATANEQSGAEVVRDGEWEAPKNDTTGQDNQPTNSRHSIFVSLLQFS